MTLLKRLRDEAREEYEKENKEDNVNVYRVLDITTANTVTAVLDEIEREVGRMRTVKENTYGTASNIKYVYLNDIKAIIKSKRTEI